MYPEHLCIGVSTLELGIVYEWYKYSWEAIAIYYVLHNVMHCLCFCVFGAQAHPEQNL